MAASRVEGCAYSEKALVMTTRQKTLNSNDKITARIFAPKGYPTHLDSDSVSCFLSAYIARMELDFIPPKARWRTMEVLISTSVELEEKKHYKIGNGHPISVQVDIPDPSGAALYLAYAKSGTLSVIETTAHSLKATFSFQIEIADHNHATQALEFKEGHMFIEWDCEAP